MGSVLLFCMGVIIFHMRSGMCQLDSSLVPPISDSMIIQKLSPIINTDADDLEGGYALRSSQKPLSYPQILYSRPLGSV